MTGGLFMKRFLTVLTAAALAASMLTACSGKSDDSASDQQNTQTAAQVTAESAAAQTESANSENGDVPIPRHDETSTAYESEIQAYAYPGDTMDYTLNKTFTIGDYTFRYPDFCSLQEFDKVDGYYTLHAIENSVKHYFDVYYGSTGEFDWLDPSAKEKMPAEVTLTNALDLVMPCMTVNFSDPVHEKQMLGYTSAEKQVATSDTFDYDGRDMLRESGTWVSDVDQVQIDYLAYYFVFTDLEGNQQLGFVFVADNDLNDISFDGVKRYLDRAMGYNQT